MLLSREEVTAISHLRVIANWSGLSARSESATAVYNPPPGFVVIDAQTIVHSSNNGGREVSVLAGGLNLIVETELDEVYDSAIAFAGSLNDDQLKGRLEEKKKRHVDELRRYQSSHNTVVAVVRASAHGNAFDRKRGWEEISVKAELINLGAPGKQGLAAALEAEFEIDIPDDFSQPAPVQRLVPHTTQNVFIKSAHGEFFLDHNIARRAIELADQPYNPATEEFNGELWEILDAGSGRVFIKSAHGGFFLDHNIASRSIALADQPYNPTTGEFNGELWKIVAR